MNLFGNDKKHLPVNRHQIHKPKYLNSHLSYRQRLRLLTATKYMTAKQAKEMYLLGIYLIKHGKLPMKSSNRPKIVNKPAKPKIVYRTKYIAVPAKEIQNPVRVGHLFHRTVNRKQLAKAVHVMYLRKHKQCDLTMDQICKKFHVSKPSMYRGYYKKYRS